MPKLLIVPANGAIRYNPKDPKAFPDTHNQALVPGVAEALDFYVQEGYTIAVCENAGAVERGIVSLQEKLAELITLMTTIAPQIDHVIFCTDYQGVFAYLLSKKTKNSFPEMRRLRSEGFVNSDRLKPPQDQSLCWESIDTAPFRKPEPGMLNVLMRQVQPSHTVYVWERQEDKDAFSSPGYNRTRTVSCQSAKFWRETLNPNGSDHSRTVATPAVPVLSNASPGKTRQFQLINKAANKEKFWTITMSADKLSFWINWGRIGTAGRSAPHHKVFATAPEAQRDYLKRIQEQLDQGYMEV